MIKIGDITLGLWNHSTQSYSDPFIPFDVSDGVLQSAIRRIDGYQNTFVLRRGDPDWGCDWLITYDRC